MDSVSKQHIISGVIGGITALALAFVVRKAMWARRRGHCKRVQPAVITMESERMPAAIGPYTKGKIVQLPDGSRFAYSSGQLGLDPATNRLISDSVEEQAEQVIKNLKALAEDNDMTLENTVKNVVYLTDMADFPKVNEVYKRYYVNDYPARTCIAIKQLPLGGLVEIESVFFKPSAQKHPKGH